MSTKKPITYEDAGVTIDDSLPLLLKSIDKVRGLGAPQQLDIGTFANVVAIGPNLGIALTTDGVGTKILITQMMDKYDTIGIDCVAMNVNDLLCVGATPITMVDYLAVQVPHEKLLEEIGIGLAEGAKQANINICGGELALINPMLDGAKTDWGFDLVGTAIGSIKLDEIIAGQAVQNGDIVLGISSNGLHCNGYSLARKVLLERRGLKVDSYVPELGMSLGEELLKETFIYVKEVVELLHSDIPVKGLVHNTSLGSFNLTRLETPMGFVIDYFPKDLIHPIFHVIRESGPVELHEMFQVFNMGIGFCVVVSKNDVSRAKNILSKSGRNISEIGYVDSSLDKEVKIEPFQIKWDHATKRFSPF